MSLTYIQFFLVPSSFPSPPPPQKKVKQKRGNVYANLTLIVFRDVTLLQKKRIMTFYRLTPFADSFVNSYWRELVICFHTNEQDGEQNVFMVIF